GRGAGASGASPPSGIRTPSAAAGGSHRPPPRPRFPSPVLLLPSAGIAQEGTMARSLLALFLRLVLPAGLLPAVGARRGRLAAPPALAAVTSWPARLSALAPAALVSLLGWVVVGIELVLGLLALLGLRPRQAALVAGVLLSAVAVAMALRDGLAAPFHAALFAVAGLSFAIHQIGAGRFSVDGG